MKKTALLALVHATVLSLTAAENAAPAKPADKPKAETYLTIETAGPDYAVQGEYLNDWGGATPFAGRPRRRWALRTATRV